MAEFADRCVDVSGVIGRWHAGTMRDADRGPFEQHLLCCPPCLAQNDKATAALGALPHSAADAVPDGFVDELLAAVGKDRG